MPILTDPAVTIPETLKLLPTTAELLILTLPPNVLIPVTFKFPLTSTELLISTYPFNCEIAGEFTTSASFTVKLARTALLKSTVSTSSKPVILASPCTYSAVCPVDTGDRISRGNIGVAVLIPTLLLEARTVKEVPVVPTLR